MIQGLVHQDEEGRTGDFAAMSMALKEVTNPVCRSLDSPAVSPRLTHRLHAAESECKKKKKGGCQEWRLVIINRRHRPSLRI